MAIVPGSRFGHFEVGALIGAGGMGKVYRATDTDLKREVALKVLSESFLKDPNRIARLQREAEVLAALNHANVAQIYGLERSDGVTALVMELVEGSTLADRIAQGPVPPPEAIPIALQIVDALEAAHEQGIVHRDLKPANVKLRSDGAVKVLDFGLAKALDARSASGPGAAALTSPAMTELGMVLGTAAYMAPEQARGRAVDKRADIWAFGCVLYEMLAGKPVFAGEDVTSTLARVLEREPDLSALPKDLASAVRRTIELCLQKDPRKRLRDIGDVRLALEGGLLAQPAAAARRPALWRYALASLATLVIGALLASAWERSRRVEPPVTPQAPGPVTSFIVTPPPEAPLANVGGFDLAISPDGQRIVYVGQTPGSDRLALYVRELDELEPRLLPGSETSNNPNPFFSPDGKWVGFRDPERGLIRVSVDGAPPLVMVAEAGMSGAAGGTWSTDGTLVYSAQGQAFRASAGGGRQGEQLPIEEPSVTAFVGPAMLPGDKAVLFGALTANGDAIGVLDLESGAAKILVEGGQNAVWSPTGHIVFARGTTLMAAPFDPVERVLIGEPVAVLQGVRHPSVNTAADFGLSATGTLVYVPGGAETSAGAVLVWVDRAGKVIERAISTGLLIPRDPRLSPSGDRVVLTTGSPAAGELWLYDLRGRPPIPLSTGLASRLPVWSPDGTQLAFTINEGGGIGRAVAIRADGTEAAPRPLRAEALAAEPAAWTRAGEILARTADRISEDIVALPADGSGEVRAVMATEAREFDPALSPDGRWLAYASNRSGDVEIWVKGYPDGAPVRVSPNGGFEPLWSADGRELFYQDGPAMMAVAVQAADEFSFDAPVELFRGAYSWTQGPGARSYDVARDGRLLMILPEGNEQGAPPAHIVVIQNWAEELKARVPVSRAP